MSTQRRIYLDYNATAPLGALARLAIADAMAELGNPSSVHAEGRAMRDKIERARTQVAALAGRPREHTVFTSGGTEANVLGVLALAAETEATGRPRIVATSSVEHPSLAGAVGELVRRGWSRTLLPVDRDGRVAPGDDHVELGVVALAAVNHELGSVLEPGVLRWARARGALIHVDAVQAAGKLAVLGDADAIALSAHKLGGPQGVGALVIARDRGLPIVDAGHQERGRRAGTENTLGIIGFGAAASAVDLSAWPAVVELGSRLERGLVAMGARIHGAGAPRIGGTINAAFPGALGDAIVIALDLAGVAVSTGAACTSGSIEPSPVLLALGQPPSQAREAVRFSLGTATTLSEIDAVLATLPKIVDRARQHR